MGSTDKSILFREPDTLLMQREHHKWYSEHLGREMEMLVFGHAGTPVLVFPTSMGKFFEYEDRGMIDVLGEKLHNGVMQLYCVDSVDEEALYNNTVHPRVRIARHVQYEDYIRHEVLALIAKKNPGQRIMTHGCSFGAYHAMNFALRNPEQVKGCVTMGGAFDIKKFLDGYYDEDCYFHNPPDYIKSLSDPWHLERYRGNKYILVTGEGDICVDKNQEFAALLQAKGIPHHLFVWGNGSHHDWDWWLKMADVYLP